MIIVFAMMLAVLPSAFSLEQVEASAEVIDPEELQHMFDEYIQEHGLNSDLISVGYIYTATGESWYFQPDLWYYSASLYKVPLMMLFAEKEANGELSQETMIYQMPLSQIEDEVLTYSNNDIAYSMMLYLAQPDVCRGMFQEFADLPTDYYPWDFYGSSYFSARFMTEVMETLYDNPDRFPGIADRLKLAQPEHYFRLSLENHGVEIAQKYGNYHDEEGYDWNHTSGIIYRPNPFILTVMTRYGGISETIIADLAELFYSYSIDADQRLLHLQNSLPAPNSESYKPAEANLTEQGDKYQEKIAPVIDSDVIQNAETIPGEPQVHKEETGHYTVLVVSSAVLICLVALMAGSLAVSRVHRSKESKTKK